MGKGTGRDFIYRPIVQRVFRAREDPPEDKGGDKGGDKGDKGDKKDKSYTQAEVDVLIEARLAQERRQKKGEESVGAAERAELERLRQEAVERNRKDAEAERNYNKALDSATSEHKAREARWKDEQDTMLRELRHDRIHGRIIASAALHGAINPEAVATLLADRARLDSKRQVEVLDAEGQPWFLGGKAATIDQLVKNYLDQNLWLVKPSGSEGSGAKGSKAGDGDRKTGDEDDVTIEALEEELKEAEAEFKGRPMGAAGVAKVYALQRQIKKLKDEAKQKKAS